MPLASRLTGDLTTMTVITKNMQRRTESGTAITEFTAGLVMFFCFFFIPVVDMSFLPARYLLVHTYLDKVVHRMALSEKRSQAMQYLNGGSWKAAVEKLGVTVKDAKATLVICDDTGGQKLSLAGGADVPQDQLPNGAKLPNGDNQARIYSLELAVVVDIPPLFNNKVGLPGFNKPITVTLRTRDQWENLSPDPLTTSDPKAVKYYINE